MGLGGPHVVGLHSSRRLALSIPASTPRIFPARFKSPLRKSFAENIPHRARWGAAAMCLLIGDPDLSPTSSLTGSRNWARAERHAAYRYSAVVHADQEASCCCEPGYKRQ